MSILNLGILAHVDAGKTTLTEALLHRAGALRRAGRVDHGDTVTDSLTVERSRGITVRATTVSFNYRDCKINLLDTPGHMDFIAEVERSLAVLDAAVLVLSAREGVQSQTRVLWSALRRLRIPTLFFINKLDRVGADAEGVYAQVLNQLSPQAQWRERLEGDDLFALPVIESPGLLDRLFEADEEFAMELLENEQPAPERVRESYLRSVAAARLFPVYAGVALDEKGIDELLDALTTELPLNAQEGAQRPLSALVYKLEFHPKHGGIAYLRLYGGSLRLRQTVPLQGVEEPLRITQLFSPVQGELKPVGEVSCGDIAVLPLGARGNGLRVGAVMGEKPPAEELMGQLAEPMLLTRVETEADVPREKLLTALEQLCMEDPLLQWQRNERTDALELRVFGQVQMEILQTLARERYGFALRLGEPQTIFRERPMGRGIGDVGWRDTPFVAAMGISIEPLAQGSGLAYETKVDFGILTASFQNAVKEGLLAAMGEGLYGWEITDAKITLEWAEYDSVNSTPAEYRNLAMVAVMRALRQSDTELLEPILAYTLSVPSDCAGRASYDLTQMRATMEEIVTESDGDAGGADRLTYTGLVPLDASKAYAQQVAAYTHGLGVFSVRAHGYAIYQGDKAAVANVGHEMPSEKLYLLMKAGRL